MAVVQPPPKKRGISPPIDDFPCRIEFDHWRGKPRGIQIFFNNVLPVEQVDMVTVIDTNATQPAG